MASSDSTPSADSIERAEAIYFDRLQRGGAVNLAALCAEYPHLAPALQSVHDDYVIGMEAVRTPLAPESPPRIAGRYRIVRALGKGGMGSVYEAEDLSLRRTIALKVVHGTHDGVRRRREDRLEREASLLGGLVHPGIVPVHELGNTDGGSRFFTMQLIAGQDLGEILDGGRETWPVTRLVNVLQRVCETVAYAHGHGVLHRDLKPSNVMVGPFGEVYVMDWGLAKRVAETPLEQPTAAEPLTLDGDVIGTPSYMPPEQAFAQHGTVDHRADVYAAGAMLYQMLSGRRPYEDESGGTPDAYLGAVRIGPPRALTEIAPRAATELVAIAERAMARLPEQRYASMRELADDLRAYLENRVVQAHRTGALTELCKWIGRNRLVASAFAIGLVALVGAALLQLRANDELSERADQLLRQNYANRMALAASQFEDEDYDAARVTLSRCPPQLRGWEWHHLSGHFETNDVILPHARATRVAEISPDGKHVVSIDIDGLGRLWDVAARRVLAEWRGALGRSIAFHPDGERVFVTDRDACLRIFTLSDGARTEERPLPINSPCIAFRDRQPLRLRIRAPRAEPARAAAAGSVRRYRSASRASIGRFRSR